MGQEVSKQDIFRFTQRRPPIDNQSFRPTLLRSAKLFPTLFGSQFQSLEARKSYAATQLQDPQTHIRTVSQLLLGDEVSDLLRGLLEAVGSTVADFIRAFDDTAGSDDVARAANMRAIESDLEMLSDTLLLHYCAGSLATHDIPAWMPNLFRACWALVNPPDTEIKETLLSDYLAIQISLPQSPTDRTFSAIRNAAIGYNDLLVVKQHLKRYEAVDIAHIENVMTGEKRGREHKSLHRTEEIQSIYTESMIDIEKELETEERFEMKREVEKTVEEDLKFGFSLSIAATLGPQVELNTDTSLDFSRSVEEKSKSATSFARDIMQRSVERTKELVRDERIRRVTRENTETNTHEFSNASGDPHVVGVYQFVDKIYEAQVFNYGQRLMFDFIVPEPANYLWLLRNPTTAGSSSGTEPPQLTITADQIQTVDNAEKNDPNYYLRIASLYRATGIEPPPSGSIVQTVSRLEPPETSPGPATEENTPLTNRQIRVAIPEGYYPASVSLHGVALSNRGGEQVNVLGAIFYWTIEDQTGTWNPPAVRLSEMPFYTQKSVAGSPIAEVKFTDSSPRPVNAELTITYLGLESGNHHITARIVFNPTQEHITRWKLQVYEALTAAYEDRLSEFRDAQAQARAEAAAVGENGFGVPPSKRKQFLITELKRRVISSISGSPWLSPGFSPFRVPATDAVDLVRLQSMADTIRFFELAFEWEQLQYAFYPYFWGRPQNWPDRLQSDNDDYEFNQFLQAGAARVVVPARPGYEQALAQYADLGQIPTGTPQIASGRYVSIVDELKAASGANGDARPVGESWEVRVPTSLVILRQEPANGQSRLPAWKRSDEVGEWEWDEESHEE